MRGALAFAALAVLGLAATAQGEPLDASRPLDCALAKVAECDGAAQCSDVALAEIELPEVVRVDFASRQLASTDGQRTSPIHALEALETVLVLQGQQNGRGWTMVVERVTGHLSATITGAEGVFVLSGGCTAR
jgi:hypothetical protein